MTLELRLFLIALSFFLYVSAVLADPPCNPPGLLKCPPSMSRDECENEQAMMVWRFWAYAHSRPPGERDKAEADLAQKLGAGNLKSCKDRAKPHVPKGQQ